MLVMSREASILGITQELVDQTYSHADPLVDDEQGLLHFIRGTMMRVHREQPQLYDYLRNQPAGLNIFDPLTFGAGAAFTYDMLPEQQRRQLLAEDEILAAHQSIHDIKDGNSDIDLRWYIEKLRVDSPEFSDWLGDMVTTFEGNEAKSDFIFGVVLISLPFYMRAEATTINQ